MAGGKLSPRQKLINMMYLVLTALLALNVTSEVLDAFESLFDSLNRSSETFREKNSQLVSNITSTVEGEMKAGGTGAHGTGVG